MKTVAVVDFGGQYTHLIATRIRSLGVKADIVSSDSFTLDSIPDLVGVVLSGGPHSVAEDDHPTVGFEVDTCPVPILGLCYGHQILAKMLGGKIACGRDREYGLAKIEVSVNSVLFSRLPTNQTVWMSHGDHVSALPENLKAIASSETLDVAAFESTDGKCFGLQFHPEVSHTDHGLDILDRFLELCTGDRPWRPEAQKQQIIKRIRSQVGNDKLLLLLSGGVDSLVSLKLCLEAVGPNRVVPLHIDTGLMRLQESSDIVAHMSREGFDGIRLIEASHLFLKELDEVCDPEEKRKIIGRVFVEVTKTALKDQRLDSGWCLVQGTIYPDHIESGGSNSGISDETIQVEAVARSHTIKTHHNRVKEIEDMRRVGRVVEPLIDLYKDEVRRLGRSLGLPEHLLNRHPFPGPGLGIRVLCSDRNASCIKDADQKQLLNLIEPFGLTGAILPVRSVGVQGDSRTYLRPAVLWPMKDGADNWNRLIEAARLLVNEMPSINRAVWSLQPLPDGLVIEEAFVSRERLERLRGIDAVIRTRTEHLTDIWQMPVISLPLRSVQGKEVFVIRPISSNDAMTADVFRIPSGDLERIQEDLEVSFDGPILLYDITSKPPGTIEWE